MRKLFVLTFPVAYALRRDDGTFTKRATNSEEPLIPSLLVLIPIAYVSLCVILFWNCYEASALDLTSLNMFVGTAAGIVSQVLAFRATIKRCSYQNASDKDSGRRAVLRAQP